MPKWPKFPPNRNEARASGMPFADDSRDNDAHAAGLRASGDCGGDCCCATAVAADAASAGTASPAAAPAKRRRWPPLPWALRNRRKPVLMREATGAAGTITQGEGAKAAPLNAGLIRSVLCKTRNPATGESLIAMIEEVAIEGSSIWVVMRVENTEAPITIMHRLAIEHALYALPAVSHVEILSSRHPVVAEATCSGPES
ncbi:hypothetical protein [Paracoccus cavernae]|uniref:hypothetical protein n=2 Tax=Paracoccus cavernae TaxID=1571207 RepID=UPI0035F2CA1D